jgi:Spy/CpxP family protein refolding chaperone
MKNLKSIQALALALLAAVLLSIPVAYAQSGGADQGGQKPRGEWREHGKRGQHGGRMFGRLARLNLSDAQKTQLEQIHQSFRERTKSLRQELRTKEQELHALSQGSTFNEALASQKLTEMAGLRAKLMGEEFKLRQETLAVLTPEQKTQLEQSRERFRDQRGRFDGKRAERKARN